MSEAVTWQEHAPGIWVVTLERPPANALGLPILDGLHAACDAAEAAGGVKVMVVTSALGCSLTSRVLSSQARPDSRPSQPSSAPGRESAVFPGR